MAERDLDWVIVTGAGASIPFGARDTLLPGMSEWSDQLVQKLAGLGIGHLEATGLSKGLEPQEFERQLGRFLHQVTSFSDMRDLIGPSRYFMRSELTLSAQGVLEEWHRQTAFQLDQIINAIHESLYELFAEPSLEIQHAQEAYKDLFRILGIDHETQWVYATTNYDVIGESVLARLGYRPDWGEPPQLQPGGNAGLDVDRLIDATRRYVPVLHLHGRIGWYRRTDSNNLAYASNVRRHETGFGIPIVMLPDPNKVYGSEPIINSLWTQFQEALSRAKRVLVLGHSLNDAALMQALIENVKPLNRLAVTVLSEMTDGMDLHESAKPVMQKLEEMGPMVANIPMRFGLERWNGEAVLRSWLGSGDIPDSSGATSG
jgi:hypothetical protein